MATVATLSSFWFAQAQVIVDWDGEAGDNLWSSAQNWSDDNIPDTIAERARFNLNEDTDINIDQDYTINRYVDGGAGAGRVHTLFGSGTLTIDVNDTVFGTSLAIDNATGGEGGIFRIGDAKITIDNSLGTVSTMRNLNSSGNTIIFDMGSVLTLNTLLRTTTGSGGSIQFNGTFAPSVANLQIGSSNVFFGEGHNSADFGADIVLLPNSRLTVNGGTVLNTNRKFQANGSSQLILNGPDSINGAFVSLGGANNLVIDVNADQSHFGHLVIGGGVLTLDVDAAVSNLSFGSSFLNPWGSGSVSITGFKEGTIRFGTNGAGLNRDQLSAINGGIYSLTDDGYLTGTLIRRWAGFAIDENGFATLSPWGDVPAYVDSAPYIWVFGADWFYVSEDVAVRDNGWIYAFNLDSLMLAQSTVPGVGYSFALNRWVYVAADAARSWIYIF